MMVYTPRPMVPGFLRRVFAVAAVWAVLIALSSSGCGDGVDCGAPTVITQAYLVDGGTVTLCCPPSGENAGCACIEQEDGMCPADAGQL